jgi:hypothetical protein
MRGPSPIWVISKISQVAYTSPKEKGGSKVSNARIHLALISAISLSWALPTQADVVTEWNAVTTACSGNRAGPSGLFDIALVQTAVHDAIQAIQGRFEAYEYENAALLGVGSPAAAAAAASHRTLVGLYGAGNPCLAAVIDPAVTYAGDPGLQAGNEAAAALLPLYRPSFTLPSDPFLGGTAPGEWRPTLPAFAPGAFRFQTVTAPFVLNRPSQFRPPPPPPLWSVAYARDYNEVKALGALTNSTRTPEQNELALFWQLNPVAAWNATLRSIADAHVADIGDKARLFALANLAAADSVITCWDSKYHFNFWRPITAIQEGDNDLNQRTVGDPTWLPMIPTGTPPYPDYTSGFNNLSGSFTGMLELYFGTDEFEFSILSPAAGLTVNPRQYHRFSEAAQEGVEVRILQGIHFRFADEQARRQGRRVAHWVFMKSLRPVPGTK